MTSNIILIGMPGSGKSTIGVQLAKVLGLDFIDSDIVIQSQQGHPLQALLDEQGYLALRKIEEATLLGIHLSGHTLATGGSAIYSPVAMEYLKQQGTVIYLQVSLETVLKRIDNESSRGIARPNNQSLEAVYHERVPLYERYADLTISNDHWQSIDKIAKQIISDITET